MKQVFQKLSSGKTIIPSIPAPAIGEGQLLIRTSHSLLSVGTEKMLLEFSKANIIVKAQKQPDKVKEVFDKALNEGVLTTLNAIRHKLDQSIPLGYCNVGEVISIGEGVSGFSIGDRVASNGPHAEVVLVSQNLCAKIPKEVNDEEAVFTVLGSIGLQGIRLAEPTFGETFLVIGLGLIGLLTAQLLLANGCKVLAIDTDHSKCEIAKSLNIHTLHLKDGIDPIEWSIKYSDNKGVDGVIITASTSSNEPVEVAAKSCRKKGRIILVGVTGLKLRRDLFYEKELSFQVSCSYGPGRYDANYEEKSNDYPLGYVRWTEKRNFEAILEAIKNRRLKTSILISHRFNLEKVNEAYSLISSNEPFLGVILNYPFDYNATERTLVLRKTEYTGIALNEPIVSFIGAGNHASRFLIPAFKKTKTKFSSIVAKNGFSPLCLANKFGFDKASTDHTEILEDKICNTIVIATHHDSHAFFIKKAIENNKHIFVEKPLCINQKELESIETSYTGNQILMVGYNRRFSSLIKQLKLNLENHHGPKSFIYTCNSGYLPNDHWQQDLKKGGGRLIGEACHFVDLLRFLAGKEIIDMSTSYLSEESLVKDTFTIQIRFLDNSMGTIHYFANGHKSFPKERLEIFVNGSIFQLDNFKRLRSWGKGNHRNISLINQDKGQSECVKQFISSIRNNTQSPIPIEQIFEVQRWILKAVKS